MYNAVNPTLPVMRNSNLFEAEEDNCEGNNAGDISRYLI